MWVEHESAWHHHAKKDQKEYFYFVVHSGGKYVDCRVEMEDSRHKWITNLTAATAAAAVATSSGTQVFTRTCGVYMDLWPRFCLYATALRNVCEFSQRHDCSADSCAAFLVTLLEDL